MTRTRGLADLDRAELAVLVPELLLAGHLIDRAGMPHLIGAFGRDVMRDIAIDEWMGASPVYSKRMQRTLGFEGDSVVTIFKNIQIDIGSPPQFMDFRFHVTDRDHGEFWLDHCGALMDVEPMGPDYVTAMCHDIEDPTFDATATASNPRAQVRPIHRPPRVPADRSPHCAWSVIIDPGHPVLQVPAQAVAIGATAAARHELDPIDPDDPGLHEYSGPLLSDLQFRDWSASALRRIAEEVCIQGHLLALSFLASTRTHVDSDEEARTFSRRQFTGVAGVAARRLKEALGLGQDLADVAAVLSLSPGLLPTSYTGMPDRRSTDPSRSGSTGRRRRPPTGRGRPSSTPDISSRSMPSSVPSTATTGAWWWPTDRPSWWWKSSAGRTSSRFPTTSG